MSNDISKFWGNSKGSIATNIAVLALPLMISCGVAVDYALLVKAESSLQDAADAAALASAKELGLVSTKDSTVAEVAEDYVLSSLNESIGYKDGLHNADVKTTISQDRKDVTVDISYTWKPMVIQYFNSSALPIKVKSIASLAGDQSVCVIALDQSSHASIDMTSKASMTANNCVIYSNSKSTQGIAAVKQASITGTEIMSSGGYTGPDSSYMPLPLVDTPQIDDPLKDRVQPTIGGCDYNDISIKNSVTLQPGVYCGGLDMNGSAVVTLSPGDYIIKDGPLSVRGNSSLIGDDVSFFMTGSNAVFDFEVSTQAVLGARKTGPMTGILFFEDRSSPTDRTFTIRSKDAEKFEGAIYLPKGILWIDKASKVGQRSSWTAIIANKISIGNGPDIVINADYANSTIPVPEGISGGNQVRLKQ